MAVGTRRSIRTEEAYVTWGRPTSSLITRSIFSRTATTIRTIQELLGHSDVKTTMYTHVLNRSEGRGVRSPLDAIPIPDQTGRVSAPIPPPAPRNQDSSEPSAARPGESLGDYETER